MKSRVSGLLLLLSLFTNPISGAILDSIISPSDYTFIDDLNIQSVYGWNYRLTKRDSFSYDVVVIDTEYYYINESLVTALEYISFIDIVVGVDFVYDTYESIKQYISVSWGYRVATVAYAGDNPTRFFANVTNLHCIARDKTAYNLLRALNVGDKLTINGYLVDINGYNVEGFEGIEVMTGLVFGDPICEIVVVESSSSRSLIKILDAFGLIILIISTISLYLIIRFASEEKRKKS